MKDISDKYETECIGPNRKQEDEGAGGPIKPCLDGGWAGIGIILIGIILFGNLMLPGCGISLKAPTIQMITQDVTQTAGYFIAKKYPKFGVELLEYTKDFLNQEGKELVNYKKWKEYIVGSLVKDRFLQLKVERILGMADIDLHSDDLLKQVETIRDLWREFTSGLQAGINYEKR